MGYCATASVHDPAAACIWDCVHLRLGGSAFSGQLLSVHSTELEAALTEEIMVAVQAERIVELKRGWLSTRRIVTKPRDF